MSYQERIRQERSNMSKSFAKLADFLLDSYIEAAFMTASELAHNLDLDAATVVRFSQHLGYDGFPKLQREIRQRVKADLLIRPKQAEVRDSVPGIASAAMEDVAISLQQSAVHWTRMSMEKLVDQIGQARRIVILAEGPAQPSAYSLVLFMEQGGFPVYIARSGIADLARTVNTATAEDLLVAMEIAGQAPYIARALEEVPKEGNSDCGHHRFGFTGIRPLCRLCTCRPGSSFFRGWDRLYRSNRLCAFSGAALAFCRQLCRH